MKILMTTMGMDIGGAETHILELSRELAARGHEVTVASSGGAYVEELTKNSIRHVELPLNTKRISHAIRSYRGLKKLIREERFDVVHAHARIPAFICAMLQKKMGFRFVTTTHGVYDPSLLWRLLSRWGQYSLAVSDDVRDYLIKYYDIPKNRITVTINGIDTEKFSPDADSSSVTDVMGDVKGHRILYLGRLDREVSHVAFMLISVAPRIAELYPDATVTVVGAGTSFEEIKARAEEANRAAGREIVRLTGARTDVREFMAAADLFVGVSRSALEAMAAGTPVVLAGSQGYLGIFGKEKLTDALDTNFTCREKGDASAEAIFEDIKTLFSASEEEIDRYRALGIWTVRKYYSVAQMADDALEVYDRVSRDPVPFRGHGDVMISGYYGFDNMGDDSILETVVTSLTAAKPDIRITALTKKPKTDRRRFGIRCVARMNLLAVVREMRRSKILISGGGSLFQDSTSKKSLLYYAHIVNLARRMGMKTYILANGVGVIFSEGNKKITAKTVNRADRVTVRDEESLQELVNIGVEREKIRCTADPAFMLSPCTGERLRAALRSYNIPEGKDFFVVSLRRFEGLQRKAYDEPTLLRETVAACAYAAKTYSLVPVFIVMQPNLDLDVSETACRMLSGEYGIESTVVCPADGAELLGILSGEREGKGAKFVIGMRLHLLIYAIDALVPQIGLSLDPKIDAIMRRVYQSHLFRLPDVTAADLTSSIDSIFDNYEETKTAVKNASADFKDLAQSDIDEIIRMLGE